MIEGKEEEDTHTQGRNQIERGLVNRSITTLRRVPKGEEGPEERKAGM